MCTYTTYTYEADIRTTTCIEMIVRKMGRFPDSRPKEKIRLALQDLEGFEFIWVPWIAASGFP